MSWDRGAGDEVRAGQVVAGRYRLEQEIGSGSMGTVWRALDEDAGRTVAIKRAVRQSPAGGERARRGLRREAKLAAQVTHPNVVALLDEVLEGAERYLVLEYVPAQSLATILDDAPLSPQQAIHLGAQIAGGLAAVHAHGIVHRDIKPGNVLVTENGVAKVTDFGISRSIWADATATDTGLIGGTVAFLAPEVADGQEPTAASDVFGLGATLFTAIEGVPPVGTAANPQVLLRRAAVGEFLPCRRAGRLAPVLSALLEIDPAKRPDATSAQQLLQDLAGGSARPWPVGGPGRQRRFRRRATLIAIGCVTVLMAAVVLAVFRPERTPGTAIPPPVLGDARTADPCALTDARVLSRFSNGSTTFESAMGNFNRCDVVVILRGGTRVQVQVELEKPAPLEGTMEERGALRIYRQPQNAGECVQAVLLADQNFVKITAKLVPVPGREPGSADLCALAGAATEHIVAVLGGGAIPRRSTPLDTASLARMDACQLLDSNALQRVLGPDISSAEASFANWECRWQGNTSKLSVRLAFDRDKPSTFDGRRMTLNGHETYILPETKEPDCLARVIHRSAFDENANQVNEHLRIVVKGPLTPDQLCGPATELAAAAAANLPPLR